MRVRAALDRDDLSEEEHDKLLEAAIAEALDLPARTLPFSDHLKPIGPVTDPVERMDAEIAADRQKRKPKA